MTNKKYIDIYQSGGLSQANEGRVPWNSKFSRCGLSVGRQQPNLLLQGLTFIFAT